VSFIREKNGDWFHIEVAAYPEFHPQITSAEADFQHFVNSLDLRLKLMQTIPIQI
jgi:methylenetetrahydrofolate reductase (NADPH)